MNWVGRIANKMTQRIKVVSTKNGVSIEKIYDLDDLVCEPAPAANDEDDE